MLLPQGTKRRSSSPPEADAPKAQRSYHLAAGEPPAKRISARFMLSTQRQLTDCIHSHFLNSPHRSAVDHDTLRHFADAFRNSLQKLGRQMPGYIVTLGIFKEKLKKVLALRFSGSRVKRFTVSASGGFNGSAVKKHMELGSIDTYNAIRYIFKKSARADGGDTN